jgi:hypothetical protein
VSGREITVTSRVEGGGGGGGGEEEEDDDDADDVPYIYLG